jgi:hypothetical protein
LTATLAKGSLKTVAWTVPAIIAARRLELPLLEHGDRLRIAAEFFHAQLRRVIGRGAESADSEFFAM